jgi:predicted nucleic acid-binding protein
VASPKLRVFVDADVLISGSASTSGASHIILRLSEFTVIECVCSEQVIAETERNLMKKMPHALPMFRLLSRSALRIVSDPDLSQVEDLEGQADTKDLPLLAAAMNYGCHYLVTFNTRHYRPVGSNLDVLRPGELLDEIREQLADLVS